MSAKSFGSRLEMSFLAVMKVLLLLSLTVSIGVALYAGIVSLMKLGTTEEPLAAGLEKPKFQLAAGEFAGGGGGGQASKKAADKQAVSDEGGEVAQAKKLYIDEVTLLLTHLEAYKKIQTIG